MRFKFATLLALLLAATGAPLCADVPQFRVAEHLPLDRGSGVESAALDVDARELYLARGDTVAVVNADTGKTIAEILVGGNLSAVMVAPELHRVFATDIVGGRLAIIDGAAHKLIRTVPVSKTPSTMAYYEPLRRVFVGDRSGASLSAVDATTGKVLGSLKIPDGVGQLAANTYGQIFVTSPTANKVHYVDAVALKDLGGARAGSGQNCGGISIDHRARRVFVACSNGRIAVIDTDVGMTINEFAGPSGSVSGSASAFASAPIAGWRGGAFFIGDGGNLSSVRMLSPSKYTAGPVMTLPGGTRAFVVDTKTKRLLTLSPTASGWEIVALTN